MRKTNNTNTYFKAFTIKNNLVKDLIKEKTLLIIKTDLGFKI